MAVIVAEEGPENRSGMRYVESLQAMFTSLQITTTKTTIKTNTDELDRRVWWVVVDHPICIRAVQLHF